MILTVEVKPNAKETRLIDWRDDNTVIIALHAPAIEGRANHALIAFLAKKLGIAPSLIEIIRGHHGRVKHIAIPADADITRLKKTGS